MSELPGSAGATPWTAAIASALTATLKKDSMIVCSLSTLTIKLFPVCTISRKEPKLSDRVLSLESAWRTIRNWSNEDFISRAYFRNARTMKMRPAIRAPPRSPMRMPRVADISVPRQIPNRGKLGSRRILDDSKITYRNNSNPRRNILEIQVDFHGNSGHSLPVAIQNGNLLNFKNLTIQQVPVEVNHFLSGLQILSRTILKYHGQPSLQEEIPASVP